ncbi:MAG: hypothetical protein HY753_09295 [Nitrospirae bacterium]|nr:hypothetical protein [Nitrospirota bacterium]
MINNIDLKDGFKESLKGIDANGKEGYKKIFEWLGYGGIQEDRPGSITDYILGNPTRSVHHFHNPLKTWDAAGLNDALPDIGRTYTGQSSILWGQNTSQHIGGKWSWKDAREYFYIALTGKNFSGATIAATQANREKYFTNTFRAVGQLMHLVEDASVPQHTRNDIHVREAYEAAVERMRTNRTKYPSQWSTWVSNPITFDKTILDIPITNPSAKVPISRIIDTDKYDGTNPGITANSTSMGMAEYTNANFLSEDTMLTNDLDPSHRHYFPYPRAGAAVSLWIDQSNGRQYLRKTGEGELINHFATTSYLYEARKRYFPQYVKYLPIGLDDKSYEDYASLLIPRAVGYSAGLLNYFFRGILEITAPDSYVYSITDGSKAPYLDTYGNYHQQFTKIKVKVRNITPREKDVDGIPLTYESMQNGIIQAVARYKVIPNYAQDLSNYPPDGNVMKETTYSYSISAPIAITSLSSTAPTEFSFDFSSNPIPAGITDLYLHVIFKGTLGNEQDIAIAVGMKDLMEPTHHVFWNLTDMFSLLVDGDYHLYTADEIRSNPTLSKLASGAYIDPLDTNFWIGYMSEPPANPINYVATVTPLLPGRYIRLAVLVDRLSNNYVRMTTSGIVDPGGSEYNARFQGVTNQEVGGMWQTPTPLKTFKQIRGHFYSGILRCKPLAQDSVTGVYYCPYPENEAMPANFTPYPAVISFP